MAVFRIEKTKDYTVMSNFHLRDREMTLKAKGLLSLMLSLPENWDYTMNGLAVICKDGIGSVRSGVAELEERGYLTRRRIREANGQLSDIEYIITEQPVNKNVNNSPNSVDNSEPTRSKPTLQKPICENPTLVKPTVEKCTQSITNKSINQKINTHGSTIHQSIIDEPDFLDELPGAKEIDAIDGMDSMEIYRQILKDNIEFDCLWEDRKFSRNELEEILEIMVETVCTNKRHIRIGGEDKPAEVVKSRIMKLNQFSIEYVLECLDKNTTDIRNIKSYLLTTLYNAPATMNSYYKARVQHDLYGQ